MYYLKALVILVALYGTTGQQLQRIPTDNRTDVRAEKLYKLFQARSSPLMGSESDFIRIADTYKLDWTILPAIAGVESGFETNGNVDDYNPFGYMCPPSPCVFTSYREGIERVARTLSGGSAYAGYRRSQSIYELAKVYNQVHPEDWQHKIEYFRHKIGGGE